MVTAAVAVAAAAAVAVAAEETTQVGRSLRAQ
jgi:hypothetical protein